MSTLKSKKNAGADPGEFVSTHHPHMVAHAGLRRKIWLGEKKCSYVQKKGGHMGRECQYEFEAIAEIEEIARCPTVDTARAQGSKGQWLST